MRIFFQNNLTKAYVYRIHILYFSDTTKPGEIILRSITEVCDMACCHKICNESEKIEFTDFLWESSRFEEITSELFYVGLACQIYESGQKEIVVVGWDEYDKSDKFYLHSVPVQNQNKFRSLFSSNSYKRFFNIIDPSDLHTQSVNLDFVNNS